MTNHEEGTCPTLQVVGYGESGSHLIPFSSK